MTRLDRLSDSQANAEALARRTSTYADEHAASWQVRFDRGTPPPSLRALVIDLRRAQRDEIPDRLHKRDVDGGGTPAYSGQFAHLLYGSPFSTDDDNSYDTPFRACLTHMLHSKEGATVQMARIVAHVTLGGEDPEAAVVREIGIVEPWIARAAAERALTVFWKRCSNVRLDLARSTTAA